MNNTLRSALTVAAAIVVAAILIRTFAQVRKAPPDQEEEEQREQTAKKPVWVSVQNGETVLTLDREAQSRLGISVAALEAISAREQFTAPAVVLTAQDLVALRNACLAAQTRIEKAEVNVEVSRKEYGRLKTLYQDSQNASEKALQSAEGAFRSDEAEARAARQELAMQAAAAQQSWGIAVAKWVTDGSPTLDRVLNQKELLVQVTLPPGQTSAAPPTTSLETPGGKLVQASLVSLLPRVDPRIQGLSFLYLVPAHPALASGMNLAARVPIGRKMQGVVVPAAAVVWWQGKAWVYQQTAPDRFARHEIPTDTPIRNEFFADTHTNTAKGLSPGDKVVVSGAQMLLSEEYRSQGEGGGKSDND